MLYKHKVKTLPVLLMVALIAATVSVSVSKAATVGVVDLMSNQNTSATSTHVIKFVVSTAPVANGTYTITFDNAFTLPTFVGGDFAITYGATGTENTGAVTTGALPTSNSATNWGVAKSGQVVTLTAPSGTPSGWTGGAINVNNTVIITIGSTNFATNPGTAGTSYTVALGGTIGDSGTATVPIIAPANVTITATVDPIITFSLSATTCDLGNLNSSNKGTCTYNISHSTNAQNGMDIKVSSAATLTKVGGSDPIPYVAADTPVVAGTAGNGFYVSTLGGSDTAAATAGQTYAYADQPIPASATTVISNGSAHLTATDTITHEAAVSAIIPAGSYAQTVTWTAIGNF